MYLSTLRHATMQPSASTTRNRRAARRALAALGNNTRRTPEVTTSWVRRNRDTLLDWTRCLLWAVPRAALWVALLWGGLSWFLAALAEERAAGLTHQAKQEEAMRAWREDVTAKRRAAVAALREREEARTHAR